MVLFGSETILKSVAGAQFYVWKVLGEEKLVLALVY